MYAPWWHTSAKEQEQREKDQRETKALLTPTEFSAPKNMLTSNCSVRSYTKRMTETEHVAKT